MSWVSGSLQMPSDAGLDRSGGPRLQMPNVMRQLVAGGTGWSFAADATLTYLGVAHTIRGGVFAACDDGGIALNIPTRYYVVYVQAAAPTVLRACRQEVWAATYAAQDCIGIAYLSDQYDQWLPMALPGAIPPTAIVTNTDVGERFVYLGVYPVPTLGGPPDGALPGDLPGWTAVAYDDSRWDTSSIEFGDETPYFLAPMGSQFVTGATTNGIVDNGGVQLFRKSFTLPTGHITTATLSLQDDDLCCSLYLNGHYLGSNFARLNINNPPAGYATIAIDPTLFTPGKNVIAIRNQSIAGFIAVAWRLDLT